ncbi:VWA domain-containing protein [Pseudomonas vancouverensis]|uniref:VWA domain-containing protein n=1 Tax=Pseudomonas vancouverensis TaxID=95300 RepID=A0A1H2NJB9_PSEVA|nr:VWA domain-containing protein [Pseudomonas vancouverensis]KAB0495111.1 VWA domain-containing protein [Pseudomonas vancouverensis]TDB63849.1 VWA domain-containing protein [Pseudomonas vancouverensis]SDV05532.1 Ca-activated chloride channel family protein [Pseudomonas vancouverensis]
MEINLSDLHFLRPLWLLLAVFGALLPVLWRHSQDLQRRLRSNIAPHLLPHLLITPKDPHRLRPVHLACALLVLGAIAAAGPTWEQDRPDFLENRAPLIIAIDLSPSMDASDVPPSRLEAVKHKLHDLIQRRAGARNALIAYAGSAHLVLPATDDPALLDTFIQALSTDLIDKPGKNLSAVIDQANRLLAAEKTPGTLLLITDGADTSALAELDKQLDDSDLQVLILAAGNTDGGIVHNASGQPRTDSNGRPQLGSFDQDALKQLASALDAPLGSMTLNNDDLDWIELHAEQHFQSASDEQRELHWKDAGYWLCWPLLLIALFSVRKGWSLNWMPAVLLVIGLGLQPTPAEANALTDAFFTRDQQGRWAFEHEHYPQAAALFVDPYWKGLAAYNAADLDLALASFARLDTAPAYFYLGNIYVRRFKFDQAIAAYTQALKLQPQFPEATANLALAIALQKDTESAEKNAPETKPDEIKMDKAPGKGHLKAVQTQQAASDEQWLQNLTTSPAKFLKQKFSLQDQVGAKP